MVDADGGTRTLRDTAVVSPGPRSGTYRVDSIVRDVTAERAIRVALDIASATAESARRALEAIIDAVPTAVWTYDGSGREIKISRHWVEMTGQVFDDRHANGFLSIVHVDD